MILTQSYADLGCPPNIKPVGFYYQEVELTNNSGHGLSRVDHISNLKSLAKGKIVLNARFEFHPGNSHPSYGTRRVSVTGDEYETS